MEKIGVGKHEQLGSLSPKEIVDLLVDAPCQIETDKICMNTIELSQLPDDNTLSTLIKGLLV